MTVLRRFVAYADGTDELGRISTVDVERRFFVAAHQVDVELVDAESRQFAQAAPVLLDGADDAEAVHDLVRDELRVAAADFGMVAIVVARPGRCT